MTYDLIIFDYDGVVADSEVLSSTILAEQLTASGMPTTLEDVLARYVGRRWRDNRADVEARHGKACPDDFHVGFGQACRAEAERSLLPVAGLRDFLAARPERRCIASSSNLEWLRLGLDRFGLSDAFEPHLYSAAHHVQRGKPHPDVFLFSAGDMGVDPSRVLVIEDSEAGVQAGVAAGMTVIGLLAGGHVRAGHGERLLAQGARHVAADYAAVAAFIDDAQA